MGDVTETCADMPSVIVQGALARLVEGSGSRCEANVKQRVSPLAPRAGQRNLTQLVAETRERDEPIGVAQWETKIVEKLPAELKGSLPTVEEIEAELAPAWRADRPKRGKR